MKLIYATPFLRAPPDFGHAIRNYQILNYLTARHQVIVITFGNDENGSTDRWLAERGAQVTRLPFAFGWTNSKGYRATIRMLAEYPAASFRRFDPRGLADCIQKVCCQQPDIDLLVFDTQLTGQSRIYFESLKPSVLVLLDIYQIFQWRKLMVTGWRRWIVVELLNWLKTTSYEGRILRRFQQLVAVSQIDRDYIAKNFDQAKVSLSPNGVDVDYFKPIQSDRPVSTLLFVGSFEYGPNSDAFFYFCRDILPLIRAKRPEIRFIAAGRNPSDAMNKVAESDPGIRLTGAVADVRPFYAQASLVVVPLREGSSGIKLKTLEAFGMGVPVVSTSVGCEGIDTRDGEHAARADTPHDFAGKVMWLLEHPAEAQAMAKRARVLAEEEFDWKAIAKAFEENLSAIAAGKMRQVESAHRHSARAN